MSGGGVGGGGGGEWLLKFMQLVHLQPDYGLGSLPTKMPVELLLVKKQIFL